LRDAGWIQLYCEDNQEVLDSILLAYRVAEDSRVLVPAMVCQDAFVLSHTMMQTDVPAQELVDRYLPPLELPHRVTDKAVTIGGLDFPRETEVHRKQHEEALARVEAVYAEAQDEFERVFGRRPADPVVPYRMEGAKLALVSMGTTASTVRVVVDAARERGLAVGALRVRMYRPFPAESLRRALAGCERIGVLDRDISLGLGGVLWSELATVAPPGALLQNYMIGLGGGDIRPQHVEAVLADLAKRERAGKPEIVEVG
jgi:pyruvate/2-oxoacid:ferredoxin oxidoreductase alpha subunit